MATLVCFHAHPDDEAITTGGLMARASELGHTVVLITATRGEQGEVDPGLLNPGESLSGRRVQEVQKSAQILGALEPIFLGYEDSGMMGEPTNDNPACFWQADISEAASRLVEVLSRVGVDVLTIYDDHGLYGHPDHIQVHRVGIEAAKLLDLDHVYEATANRSSALKSMEKLRTEAEANGALSSDLPSPDEFEDFGMLECDLAFKLDVSDQIEKKRDSLRAHKTQVSEQSFFLEMSDEHFGAMFGHEWFAIPGGSGLAGPRQVNLLPGL